MAHLDKKFQSDIIYILNQVLVKSLDSLLPPNGFTAVLCAKKLVCHYAVCRYVLIYTNSQLVL
jgi:hypothetical protein